MKIRTLIIGFLLFSTAPAFCQHAAQYSLYTWNPLHWNPAYAGLDHSLSATALFRKQWTNLQGAPVSQNLNVHMPLYFLGGGVGLNIENDVLGAEQMTTAELSYNYQLNLGSSIFSIGLGGGIVQRSLDGAKLRTPGGIYDEPGAFDHMDDLLPLGRESAIAPVVHAGVYFQSEKWEAGVSVKNLTENNAALPSILLQQKRHFFFTFSYHWEISQKLSLHPSVLVRSDVVQTQTDFSLTAKFNDNIFGGVSLRGYNSESIDAAAILAGFRLSEKTTFMYAYDMTLSGLRNVSNGSHEVGLRYNLNKPIGAGRLPRIIYNPRSL